MYLMVIIQTMFYLLNSMIEPCKSHTWCCIKIGVVWFSFQKELLASVLFIYLLGFFRSGLKISFWISTTFDFGHFHKEFKTGPIKD